MSTSPASKSMTTTSIWESKPAAVGVGALALVIAGLAVWGGFEGTRWLHANQTSWQFWFGGGTTDATQWGISIGTTLSYVVASVALVGGYHLATDIWRKSKGSSAAESF